MSDLVVNDTVKMEWAKNLWVQTKGTKKKEGIFIFSCVEYEGSNGVVPVFFRPTCAWVFKDEDGSYLSFDDVREFVKTNFNSSFPEMIEGYVNLYELGDDECKTEILEMYGIEDMADDIKARVMDIAPYGESPEVDA